MMRSSKACPFEQQLIAMGAQQLKDLADRDPLRRLAVSCYHNFCCLTLPSARCKRSRTRSSPGVIADCPNSLTSMLHGQVAIVKVRVPSFKMAYLFPFPSHAPTHRVEATVQHLLARVGLSPNAGRWIPSYVRD
mmetsp:Transcript_26293/g.48014  ORF Transcript_26293/g.48014 Transcript_26293/m.48014 type:complete len:134 (+) Transcript_26293:1371-1772(+)